ncbi:MULTISPECIES: SusC/RagA family TonB-linked outer membrane protein [Spirosoma]|uniref:SusC/RagA family TonB-linked outer membrane protein n=1 Tax=Spirosoma liriopis TaxID=2937440 RepID=A0ABT0HJN7_9BACT|nr:MULTISPECIES: SusC/RagA family TonB-linked outer membrane protein [Spirosoma]MCK8492379.1 SusC/RagA family TonB-linked outer membrane protein [Spirosoma liriopis]UHG91852.1 SusC/RagA family TonB-linked outer membrane protein [Spirosoma oryzicola]
MKQLIQSKSHALGLLLWAAFLFTHAALAQDRRVTGRVVSSKDQQTIPGVNVLVKNTQIGTTSDADGNFSLNTPPNATLVISAIGFTSREIAVGNQTQLTITLQEAEQSLNEVVVTALGIKKEAKRLGYATAVVTPEQVTTNRTVNFMNALQGKIAGVNISSLGTGAAGTSKIRIRGQSSFSGQNSPLIVVNGVPIDNTNFGQNNGNAGSDNSVGNRGANYSDGGDGLSSINPDDIEGMTVLKGGTAAALYGSRAKDGAILITTKTKGTGQGIGVTYNTNFTTDHPLDYTDYQYEYGQGEYGVRPTAPNPTSGVWSFGEKFQPGMTQVLFGGLTVPYEPVRNRINTFYRDGSSWTNSISISTGTERGGLNLSVSNLDNKGITRNNTYNRKTINLGFSYNLSPKLSVTGTINYSNEYNKNPPQIAQQDNSTPTVIYTVANSMPLDVLEANQINPSTGNEFVWSRFMNRTNPYFVMNYKFENIRRDRLFGNIAARYNFTDWLYLQGRVGQDYWSRDQDYNFPTGQASLAAAPAGFVNGNYVQESRRFREINADFLIGANRKFGAIGVDLTVGGNQLYRRSDLNSVLATDFIVRGLYVPQNGRVKDPLYGLSERKVNSLYGAAEISYKDVLFLNGTLRNDWFSTLAPGNRSILYPSLTGSFVFSQAFNNLPAWLNFGKVRAAYAQVGSDGDVAPYSNNLFYAVAANLFPNPSGQGQPVGTITSNTVPSASLRPSRVNEAEVGLELKLFNNRVGLDFAYYNKVTSDQIVSVQVSDASGYTSSLINSGQSRNRGVEVLLNLAPVRTKNFSWDVTLNGSYNKTKLLRLLTDDDGTPEKDYNNDKLPEQIVVGTGIYVGELRQVVGKELGQLYTYGYARDAQGRIIHGGDGLANRTATPVSFGSALPKYIGGITNSFNYKGVSLSFLIDFKLGGKMISGTNLNAFRHGLQKETLVGRGDADNKMVGVGVNANGETNAVRAFVQDYYSVGRSKSLGEQVLYDAGFWKLRQISVGYDFTKFLPKTLFIKGIRLNAVANNVAILKKWVPNIDPEQFGFSSDNLVGLESTGLPTTRSIGFNLNVRF